MDFKDYYKILEVEKTASDEDIRKAYRKLVRKYHPDVSKEADAQERMRDVNEANDVLSDKEKRQAYDELYDRVKNGGQQWGGGNFQPPPNWDEGFSFRRSANSSNESDFSDFFSSLFGAARHGAGMRGGSGYAAFKERGEDQHSSIEISLQDAIKGVQKDITLRSLDANPDGQMQWQPRTLRVTIPPGTRPKQFIRLNGQGMPGQGGGANGDLYLEVRIAPHPLYEVDGKDIYMKLKVTPTEAALGAQIQVPLPDGQKVNVTVAANTANGSKLRLKDKGFPGQPPGNLYLNIEVVLPPALTEAAKNAYRALADAAPLNPRAF